MPVVQSETEPKTPQEIDAAIQQNRQKMQQLHTQKRQLQAAEARAAARKNMTPEVLKADESYDALFNKVFGNADGLEVLKYFELSRPVVADMIKERLMRADPNFGKISETPAPETGAANAIASTQSEHPNT